MLTIDEIRETQDLFYSVIGNHGGESVSQDFGHFVTYTLKKSEIPYGERLKVGQFQNTYGHYRKDVNCPATKEIYMVMELQYPFVVEIAD